MRKLLIALVLLFGPDVIWSAGLFAAYYTHAPIACVVVSLLGVELCP